MFQIHIDDTAGAAPENELNLEKVSVYVDDWRGDSEAEVKGIRVLELSMDGEPKWRAETKITFAYKGGGLWALDSIGDYDEFDADDPGFEILALKDWERVRREDRTTVITLIRALYRPEPPHAALNTLRSKKLAEKIADAERRLANLRAQQGR